MSSLRFETIDLQRHGALATAFRRDSFVCSFDDGGARFDAENGPDGTNYLRWLRDRVAELPLGCVHAWRGDEIVGQLEMRVQADGTGYVNLFYLRPDCRGTGLADELHGYVVRVFAELGVSVARLSASPTNRRALRYYEKHGWKDIGERQDLPDVHAFELEIPA